MGSLYGFRNPESLTLNLTTKCNQLCLNCPNDENFWNQKITKEDLFNFVDENWDDNISLVGLIGGEPTISPFFFETIYYLLKHNSKLKIHINSNGLLFYYPKFCENFQILRRTGCDFHIEFGIYSPNGQVHDSITQVNGSWEKSLQGLKNMLSKKFNVGMRTVVSKMNYKTLKDYGRMIEDNNLKEITSFTFIGMDVIGTAYQNREKLLVSHLDQAPEIEKGILSLLRVGISEEKIQVHLLPKALFSKPFQKFVVKSDCVDGAFIDNGPLCKKCIFYNQCPHLLKSYVQFFGINEHQPVLTNKKTQQFFLNNKKQIQKQI